MELTVLLFAVIVTLLAVVVASSVLCGAPSSGDPARGPLRPAGGAGSDPPGSEQKTTADQWAEVSGSSHDHWDVVRSVLSEEPDPADQTPSQAAPEEDSGCTCPSVTRSDDLHAPAAGGSRRSLIGLSEQELLKCAFSCPQTEGLAESPGFDDMKYVPGQARSKCMETMMSTQELEEEQRVQREQLAAIFQLLRDNKETFGEVSEGQLEDQLRLYSV